MSATASDRIDFDDADSAWERLAAQIEAFIGAWEGAQAPPDLREYLPEESGALRRLALIELIKVDLENRCQRNEARDLDEYIEEFPELLVDGEAPCDLIYEDFHIRRQAGHEVAAERYLERFPKQATQLERLLGIQSPYKTTLLVSSSKPAAKVDVGDDLDDFTLINLLGEGAFARVYMARQKSMQRLVALKISTEQSDEPQTLAQLDHPHIVRVYDQRDSPERKLRLLYMQYVPGGTLHEVIDEARGLPAEERSGEVFLRAVDAALEKRGEIAPESSLTRRIVRRLSWAETVCWVGARLAAALDYAHRRRVLHRDIKPANVLLTAEGSPKLADFNISYGEEVEGASPRSFFGGSVAYMSGEQLEAYHPDHPRQPEDLDGRSDCYSLALMLWEMLTLERPFEDEFLPQGWEATISAMIERRREGVPEALRREALDTRDDCQRTLGEVLLKGLEPDRENRYASAEQLARELELCLEPRVQELLRPPPGSLTRKLSRWPLTSLITILVAANVALSVLNIAYNFEAMIVLLGDPAKRLFQDVQLMVVNGVLYTLGIVVCLAIGRPVLRALMRVQEGETLTLATWSHVSGRCLRLGHLYALVILVLWTASGVIFPTWLDMTADVRPEHYMHFIVSQVLCGLLAAALSFYLATYVTVRAIYPKLIPPEVGETDAGEDLDGVSRLVSFYFAVMILVPMAAILLLVFAGPDWKTPFAVMAGVGILGFFLAFWLGPKLQADLQALALAVNPVGELLRRRTEGMESLLASSRR